MCCANYDRPFTLITGTTFQTKARMMLQTNVLDVHKLTEVIDQLDPDERHFIYLRYTLEMGYREISELLNISEDAAKKRGQRLIKKLRKLYEER